jgi:transaldolase
MKIFLDTADTDLIQEIMEYGIIDGVTTNPTLIRKTGRDPMDVYSDLVGLGLADISMEVSGDCQQMFDEAIRLADTFGSATTIKLPMTKEGLLVCNNLKAEKIRTNVTLVFNMSQAVLAAKAGATYVSPFVGRIDDQGYAGLEVVRGIAQMFRALDADTKVLAASIRTPHRAVRSMFNGAYIVTMPPAVYHKMYKNVLTDVGLEIFDNDIKSINEAHELV